MSDYLGFPNMPNIPNPSEWKHADTAKAWAEKANKSEAHVEAMVELFDDSIDNMAARLNDVNDRLEEVTTELDEAEEEMATSLAAAQAASTAAQTASTAAQTAATSASAAITTVTTAATTATTAATNASNSAAQAGASATNASASEDAAEDSAEAAAASAAEAAASVASITDEVEQCATSAASALSSATAALASENAAATSATNAGTYATAAATSRNEAANYSSAANTSKLAAAVSATNAATSETNAATSASNAYTAATTATTAASTATTAKGLAETAATTATTKATEAAASATAADSSETAAQGYSESAQNSATAAANSAAQAAQSAATFDATEYANPTAQTGYADNGIGRNKKRVDDLKSDLGYVNRSVVPSSQEVSSFNCVYKYVEDNLSRTVTIPGSSINSDLSILHDFETIITLTTSVAVTPQSYKNCAFLIHNFNPNNDVAFQYKETVDSDYIPELNDFVLIEAKDIYPTRSVDEVFPQGSESDYKSYYFIWLKESPIYSLKLTFTSDYVGCTAEKVRKLVGPISLGVCTITTAPNPKPAYYLGSKASSIDFGTGLVKRDHRVRVHINLPYAKNTANCELNALGLGFSGANFCPDSLVQYGNYNRYSGYNPYRNSSYSTPFHKRNGNVDVDFICQSTYSGLKLAGSTNSDSIVQYSNNLKTTCLGRAHSGWASWIVPGILGSDDLSGNQPFGNGTNVSFGVPYMKTYVPINKDLTEDSISKINALNESVVNSSLALNVYNRVCRYNQQFNNNSSNIAHANKNYMMYCYPSTLTECANASSQTNVTNPYTAFYAGMNFRVNRGTTTNTPTTDIKSAKGISNGNFVGIDNSKLWNYNDERSVRYTNNWHSNPLLPGCFTLDKSYNDNNESSILDNRGSYTYTLGIRYFDATAQEWRVFSPGDNCSYGYDGTHWNYREFLWVDLDKPVTYIVGGLQSAITGDAYKVNWSEFLAATSMSGTSNLVYGKHYMPTSTAFTNSPVSSNYGDGDSSSVNDLIHVETPNFDNYTSYTKWRRFTLMTVDYSSSPLGEYDTVYCADSAYNPDGDEGITKFSCVYSASPYLGTSFINDSTKTTAVKDSFIAPMNYSRISPNTTANTENALDSNMYTNKLLVAYDKSFGPNTTEAYYGPNTPHAVYGHTAYHIRIAKYE